MEKETAFAGPGSTSGIRHTGIGSSGHARREAHVSRTSRRPAGKAVLRRTSSCGRRWLQDHDRRDCGPAGPSGCGKTTTLRCIAGLEDPTSGEILIGGVTVSAPEQGILVPPRLRNIGMVFQSYAVWPHMTVHQNVSYPLGIGGSVAPKSPARSTRCSTSLVCQSRGALSRCIVERADAACRSRTEPRLQPAAPTSRRALVKPRREAAPAPTRRPAPHYQRRQHHSRLRDAWTRPRPWC